MGKNRIRESLIKEIATIIVHEIVRENTNKPESKPFLESEIIEYRNRAEKTSEECSWNAGDKEYIEKKVLKTIIGKLDSKYSDVQYSEQEAIKKLKKMINDIFEIGG